MYNMEIYLSELYSWVEDKGKSKEYLDKANSRKELINTVMWNSPGGYYIDFIEG